MAEASYRFRRSLRAEEQGFTITEDALIAAFGAVPLTDITEMRVFTTPGLRSPYGTVAPPAHCCTIRCRGGRRIDLSSLHFLGLGRFEDRAATYMPFVRVVIANVMARSPGTRLVSGMPSATWWCLTAVFAVLTAALALVVVLGGIGMAIDHQKTGGAVLTLLVLALISIGPISYLRWLWRRRPHPFDPASDGI
jgi:hypothetical protein